MLDVAHLEAIHDEHGHERGDRVLQQVAQRLVRALRTGDLAHRIGGQEFLVLAADVDLDASAALAERLRKAVSGQPVEGLAVTVSAGVSSAPSPPSASRP